MNIILDKHPEAKIIDLKAESKNDSFLLEGFLYGERLKILMLQNLSKNHKELQGVQNFVVASKKEIAGVLETVTLAVYDR